MNSMKVFIIASLFFTLNSVAIAQQLETGKQPLGAPAREIQEAEIQACQLAVRNYPKSAEAYFNLGKAYLVSARLNAEKAIDAFKQAIALKPDYPQAYLGLGNV